MAFNRLKIVLVLLVTLIGVGSYVHNDYLIDHVLRQEKQSVELWAKAIEYNSRRLQDPVLMGLGETIQTLQESPGTDSDVLRILREVQASAGESDFVTSELIIKERVRLPMVVVDERGAITASRHVEPEELTPELVAQLADVHPPIEIQLGAGDQAETQYVYYGESRMVRLLRYFPYFQLGFVALLVGVGFTGYRSILKSEQSGLWVGMAKEAAHQLGTPLSGMYGWIELLKGRLSGAEEKEIVQELESDVTRLATVAERFNKIGSSPELKPTPLEPILHGITAYMQRRLPSKGLELRVDPPAEPLPDLLLNRELFEWALENLIKNAADAGSTRIVLCTSRENGKLLLDVTDNGSGISRRYWEEIFRPGHSSKKRGWGLGLTLTRRIVTQYHGGRVAVHASESGVGTTMRITLPVPLVDAAMRS